MAEFPVAAVVSGASQVGSFFAARKSRKFQKKARQAIAQIRRIQNYQAKRQFVNQFYQAQGIALAKGSISGADLGSSLVQGTMASQATQYGVGMFELQRQNELNVQADYYLGKASKYSGIQSAFQLGSQFAQTFPDMFNKIGNKTTETPSGD